MPTKNKTSFKEAKFIIVSCAVCGRPFNENSEFQELFLDKDEAIQIIYEYDWKVKGNLATCPDCQ